MSYILYGDGIHDDTAAIQEMIDNSCEVVLPAPKAHYLISNSLILHSNFRLVLPRFAEIRLAPASNCVMIRNVMVEEPAERVKSGLCSFLNKYSPNAPCENIEVCGGIWNFNNKNQNPNPLSCGKYEPEGYSGFGMLFYNVNGLKLSHMTMKDPCNFSVTMDTISHFYVNDITFDFNDGNLYQSNMDGLHIMGHSHDGTIENLFGTCYDDIVALNAQEGSCGPITDVTVRGIYTKGSYSAVRLLTASPEAAIRNIHITDIHGTFYHFGISLQHYYGTGKRGILENITIDNIYAAKSDRDLVKFYMVHKYRKYGIIDVEGENDIKNLTVRNVHRQEYIDDTATVLLFKDAVIDNLSLDNITSENHTSAESIPLISSEATITNKHTSNLYEDGKKVEF
ncbi:MAG: hypothetical protein IJO52_11925 [Clostridia bacterium]|nr:hypothetical protein [Clostridia bacterium]